MRVRNLVRWILIGAIVLVVVLYGFSKTRDLIFGTSISIVKPLDGQSFESPLVSVEGRVGHVTKLEMNGKLILPDEDGNFKKSYALIPGLNRVTITATDRFDRTISKTLSLYYKTNKAEIEPILEPTVASSTPPTTATSMGRNSATSTKVGTTTNFESED